MYTRHETEEGIYELCIISSLNYMHTPNFDYKISMARAETELCGLCLGIPGFILIVGFLMLQCPVALLGIRCLRAFALLSLRPRNNMA